MDFRNRVSDSQLFCVPFAWDHMIFPLFFLLNYRLGHLVIVGVAVGELEASCVLGDIPIV